MTLGLEPARCPPVERPQLARYREFLQADADVIADGKLDLRFDIEMVRLLRSKPTPVS